MGLSDTPTAGYGPRDFAADVRAAIRAAGYSDFVLFGHSMGVPISLELALTDASGIAALVLGDTPAQYIDFKRSGTFDGAIARQPSFANWDEAFEGAAIRTDDPVADRARFDRVRHRYLLERDGRITTSWSRQAIERTVEESVDAATDYWDRLGSLTIPALLLDATEAWTPMTDADVERYRRELPRLTVVALPTGHDLGMSFPVRTEALFEALRRFLIRPI